MSSCKLSIDGILFPSIKEAVLKALNSDFKDFEDALQNFSAQNDQQISIIITRNINGSVEVL
jgi:hypothetical protein